jgi:hypothetical protein
LAPSSLIIGGCRTHKPFLANAALDDLIISARSAYLDLKNGFSFVRPAILNSPCAFESAAASSWISLERVGGRGFGAFSVGLTNSSTLLVNFARASNIILL